MWVNTVRRTSLLALSKGGGRHRFASSCSQIIVLAAAVCPPGSDPRPARASWCYMPLPLPSPLSPPGSDLHPPHTAAAHTYFDHFDRQVANYHRRTHRLKSALRPCAKALLCPTLDAVRSVRQQHLSMMPSRQVTYYLWCSVECCGPQSTMHVGGGRW